MSLWLKVFYDGALIHTTKCPFFSVVLHDLSVLLNTSLTSTFSYGWYSVALELCSKVRVTSPPWEVRAFQRYRGTISALSTVTNARRFSEISHTQKSWSGQVSMLIITK